MEYLVWSNEHGAWWRPKRCGYTMYMAQAGRYSRDEAIEICRGRDGFIDGTVLTEVPVRLDDAEECLGNLKLTHG